MHSYCRRKLFSMKSMCIYSPGQFIKTNKFIIIKQKNHIMYKLASTFISEINEIYNNNVQEMLLFTILKS